MSIYVVWITYYELYWIGLHSGCRSRFDSIHLISRYLLLEVFLFFTPQSRARTMLGKFWQVLKICPILLALELLPWLSDNWFMISIDWRWDFLSSSGSAWNQWNKSHFSLGHTRKWVHHQHTLFIFFQQLMTVLKILDKCEE